MMLKFRFNVIFTLDICKEINKLLFYTKNQNRINLHCRKFSRLPNVHFKSISISFHTSKALIITKFNVNNSCLLHHRYVNTFPQIIKWQYFCLQLKYLVLEISRISGIWYPAKFVYIPTLRHRHLSSDKKWQYDTWFFSMAQNQL